MRISKKFPFPLFKKELIKWKKDYDMEKGRYEILENH